MAPPPNRNNINPSSNFDFGSSSLDSDIFRPSSSNRNAARFDDTFGGASTSSNSGALFNLNSIYYASASSGDDFGSTSKVQYDDVFASSSARGRGGGGSGVFDALPGGFSKEPKSLGGTRSEKDYKGVSDFDDLQAGFGSSSRPSSSDRHPPDICWSSEPTASTSKTISTLAEDRCVVFESPSAPKDSPTMLKEREKKEMLDRERQQKEREEEERRRVMKEREQQQLERDKARQAVERATREARGRAAAEALQKAQRAAAGKVYAEVRERSERAAVQRAQAEARERAAFEAKERAEKAVAEAKEKEKETRVRATAARVEAEARVKVERAAVERAAVERAAADARERASAEARERASATARMNQQKKENDLESFFGMGERASSVPRPPRTNSSDSVFETQFQSDVTRKSTAASPSMKKSSSATNIADDLSSIFGSSPSSGDFKEVEGESEERQRARLECHQRSQERMAKALAEKNQRDLQTQREQVERHRLAETLEFEIKRWVAGKEGNLRALLSTLQYVLWPECGWEPVSLTDLITVAAVKKVYKKATLCIHPDKVLQKSATLPQKYIAEKVFDILKEAWNKLNSEELF
ncbi:unnamed protein product [Lupinus luteus]|uniref:Uncharacterized protein n=1 Tax=Lupinus luteus TaxID=3873 RepID=A0AAV1XW87_LUPLU